MNDNFVSFSQQDTEVSIDRLVLKLLVFPIKNLYLALPVDYVNKVINENKIYSSGLNHVGMIRVEEREITIVDLHKKIYLTPVENDKKGYFILTQNNRGEQFGIHTIIPPSIFDVPLPQIRQLPNSYRQADTLSIASHVTTIPKQELLEKDTILEDSRDRSKQKSENYRELESNTATIFILDVDRLID